MNKSNENDREPIGPIYESFVTSVFSDSRMMVLGLIPSIGAILLSAYITGAISLYLGAVALLLVGATRCLITSSFHKAQIAKTFTLRDFQIWEFRYTCIAITHAAVYGLCFLAATFTGQAMAEFITVVVIFANLIGVCSRSFPISRLVNGQIIAVGAPFLGALMYKGGVYIAIAVMLSPYVIGLRALAARQRKSLTNDVTHRRRAEKLATQVKNALENVPQGICMFDAAGNLEVANKHISLVLGRSMNSLQKTSIMQMVDLLQADFKLSKANSSKLKEWLLKGDHSPIAFSFETGSSNKRTIKFKASRMDNGGVIATFEDITREVKAANQIEHMVRFDRLTGLMNRSQLPGHIDEKLESLKDNEDCAVLILNINRFKHINDTMGHAAGDIVLCKVAKRLKQLSGRDGICARFSGDEFAIALSGENSLDLAINFADTIIDEFSKPVKIQKHKLRIDCSIGIATNEAMPENAEELLKHADLALLWAKKDGNRQWRVHTVEMSRELEQLNKLESDLRVALEKDQFEAYFQPIVNLRETRVSVCEALIRWKHPERGFVSPAKFIPLAENLGLIDEIGTWMLNVACESCAGWPEGTRVAVNLSPVQFKSGTLKENIQSALEKSGLEPNRLELEITESLMLENVGETVSLLNELKQMGVRISLDDFGTGYSSLNYMNELPLDKIKIDRSFVMEIQENSKSLTMVQAISSLSRNLGLTVVVEGIETQKQLSMLCKNAQIDEIQGYLFSKPVDSAEVCKLLDTSSLAGQKLLSNIPGNLSRAA